MQTTALNFIEKCLDNSVVVGDTVNLGEGHDPHSQIWDIWDIKLVRMSLEYVESQCMKSIHFTENSNVAESYLVQLWYFICSKKSETHCQLIHFFLTSPFVLKTYCVVISQKYRKNGCVSNMIKYKQNKLSSQKHIAYSQFFFLELIALVIKFFQHIRQL